MLLECRFEWGFLLFACWRSLLYVASAASPSFQRDRCAIHPFQMTLAAYQCTGNGGQYWSRLLEHLPKWGGQKKPENERSMGDFSCLALWMGFGSPAGKLLHQNHPLINFYCWKIPQKVPIYKLFCKYSEYFNEDCRVSQFRGTSQFNKIQKRINNIFGVKIQMRHFWVLFKQCECFVQVVTQSWETLRSHGRHFHHSIRQKSF